MYLRNERMGTYTSRLILHERNSHGRFHARPEEALAVVIYTAQIPIMNCIYKYKLNLTQNYTYNNFQFNQYSSNLLSSFRISRILKGE